MTAAQMSASPNALRYRLSRCRGDAHAAGQQPPWSAAQTVDRGGDLFNEIADVLNGPPPLRQDIGRQREVVNLSVPEVQIAANAAGFQAFRHELGVRKQQFIGARVDGDRRQGGQIGVHR